MSGVSLPTTTQDPLVKTLEQLTLEQDLVNSKDTYLELIRYVREGSALSICLARSKDPHPNYHVLLKNTLNALQWELKSIPGGPLELRKINMHYRSESLAIEYFRALANKIHDIVEDNIFGHYEEQRREENRDDRLEVSNCNPSLSMIPSSIQKMRSLTYLNLQANALTELPEELFGLERLTYLHLADNRLKSIPAAIGRLRNLRVLDVEFNDLKSLPHAIEDLTQLEVLRASNNQLANFALNTSRMHRLGALYLYNNELTSVTMYPASSLGYVHLENNRLTRFPNIEVLHRGCQIYLSGNPLDETDIFTFKNEALQVYFVGYEKPVLGKKRSRQEEEAVNKQ
jgi:Leucine-rich repeat (LRR) protein